MYDFFIQVLATLASAFIIFLASKIKDYSKNIPKRIRRIILYSIILVVSTWTFTDVLEKIIKLNYGVKYFYYIVLLSLNFFNIFSAIDFIRKHLSNH